MAVKRIVANIHAADTASALAFYGGILDMQVVMDLGWIVTMAGSGGGNPAPQLSFASEGGSGTPVPDLSIEVDDLDEVLRRVAAAGLEPEYGPAVEPWGVHRFFIRDPFGRLVNILMHC
ncbi:VOC family protein [Massilia luteola]|uniref:VOC family protein n=1 Tax=Massilia luteola TaxID=3081751 RepID=UPI002ACBEFBC|nr:VOC family protein [Massilia sp. Gc5]